MPEQQEGWHQYCRGEVPAERGDIKLDARDDEKEGVEPAEAHCIQLGSHGRAVLSKRRHANA